MEYRDVIIVGAGLSGIGAACHLQRDCPQKSYLILEAKTSLGGTWDTFKYPGIRSDNSLFTYAYGFKPWNGPPIATGKQILNYLQETVEEHDLTPHIRLGQPVNQAEWSTEDALWTITTKNVKDETCTFRTSFLFMCQGYYNHKSGYQPNFEGQEAFKGQIIHPQQWPKNLEYDDKHMVVIGSGATAATIVPAVADRVAHVTQLQRSPSYYLPVDYSEEDELIKTLRSLDVPQEWINDIKRRLAIEGGREFTERALNEPAEIKQELLELTKAFLPDNYDLSPNFTPSYEPWRERLCMLPEGDLLTAVASGKASIVTDQIKQFTEDGLLLQSGQTLKADIVVTATGLELCGLGNIHFEVNGQAIGISDTWTYKGIMMSDIPNLAWTFGYIRSSWTLRADLIAGFVCRLLNYMDEKQLKQCTPRLRPTDQSMEVKTFIDSDDFAPGYMRRGAKQLPRQGDQEPWTNCQNYYVERDTIPNASFEDGVLEFQN